MPPVPLALGLTLAALSSAFAVKGTSTEPYMRPCPATIKTLDVAITPERVAEEWHLVELSLDNVRQAGVLIQGYLSSEYGKAAWITAPMQYAIISPAGIQIPFGDWRRKGIIRHSETLRLVIVVPSRPAACPG